jgi:Family of unknown function (DUF6158)
MIRAGAGSATLIRTRHRGGTVAHHSGVPAAELSEEDLTRELAHVHETRHGTFLHGSPDALMSHTRRTGELEAEYLRRHPEREIDPDRLRSGARER